MPTYRVIGPQPVNDTSPGNTFTANLPPDQEEFLIAVGHIREEKPPLKAFESYPRKPSDADRR